jgi:diaminohydroxyphosphoribosylaminopyrimidine deaminase/5-amino-6-(5-phosphoribosylamino)uracil reductase
VVLDPRLTLRSNSRLARSASEAPVLVFSDERALDGREKALEALGVEVVGAPRSSEGLDLLHVLEELGRRGSRGLLVEGGGETAARFVGGRLADKITLFYAPKLVGSEGVPMIGALRVTKMAEALRFSISNVETVGEDVAVTLYPAREEDRVHRAG